MEVNEIEECIRAGVTDYVIDVLVDQAMYLHHLRRLQEGVVLAVSLEP